MSRTILNNKPLLEAIFELRWKLRKQGEFYVDTYYSVLPKRLGQALEARYPFYDELPAVDIPDELAANMIQYRFRAEDNGWPLVQLGPGIVTLNDTKNYSWENNFEERITHLVDSILNAFPRKKKFAIDTILLRYVNAIDFNYKEQNILNFLRDEMKVSVDFIDALTENPHVNNPPLGIDLRFSFPCNSPPGIIHFRFTRASRFGKNQLLWEIIVQTSGKNISSDRDAILHWANLAHNTVETFFFQIIHGSLQRRFE